MVQFALFRISILTLLIQSISAFSTARSLSSTLRSNTNIHSSLDASSSTTSLVTNPNVKPSDEWELDCYSRPVMVGGKKLWEVLITDSSGSFRLCETLPSNKWVTSMQHMNLLYMCESGQIIMVNLALKLRCETNYCLMLLHITIFYIYYGISESTLGNFVEWLMRRLTMQRSNQIWFVSSVVQCSIWSNRISSRLKEAGGVFLWYFSPWKLYFIYKKCA